MSNPVFYAAPEQLAGLTPGSPFVLGGAEGHHASTVKRLTVGEPVDVCDGGGLRLVCRVAEVAKDELTVRIEQVQREASPAVTLTLVQALAKGDRAELAIEMATELGIDAVVPWQAERSIVRWKMDKAAKGPQKWRQVVAAAAKQARRASIPSVGELAGTSAVCERIAAADLALILHEEAGVSVASLAKQWNAATPATGVPRNVLMVVGPEGGMSQAEVTAFIAAGASTALLGHHVLRSSTAGPAAVVVLNQELGRWS